MSTAKLGDLIDIKHGFAFSSQYFCSDGRYVLLTPGNFYEAGGFKAKVDQKHYEGPVQEDFILKPGDLLVAMTEQGEGLLGSAAFVPDGKPCLHNQRLGLITPKPGAEVDLGFVYYALNWKNVRQQIRATASGAKIRHTSPSRIGALVVPKRGFDAQRRIAAILRAYDDLIEVNRRRVAVLEEMARGLFEEWFVRFRFPGHESVPIVDTPDGPLPEGWTTSRLRDIATATYGFTASASKEPVGPKFLRIMDINKSPYIDWERVPYAPFEGDPSRFALNAGDIVVGRMADVGRVGLVDDDVEAIAASYLVRLRLHDARLAPFAYYLMVAAGYHEYVTGASTGTTRKSAGIPVLTGFKFACPPERLMDLFARHVASIRALGATLTKANGQLAASRDLLLPRLISGQLSVNAAERELELAA